MKAELLINLAYIVAAILFIVGLKMLGRQSSARRWDPTSASVWPARAARRWSDKPIALT